jgi:hypothetical protein
LALLPFSHLLCAANSFIFVVDYPFISTILGIEILKNLTSDGFRKNIRFRYPEARLGGWMARHNREGQGVDQQGHAHSVKYQPDWLRQVKVTRTLDSGRQSTKTLFRNPASKSEASPGGRVRTRIQSAEQQLDIEVSISDPGSSVRRIQVHCAVPTPGGGEEEGVYTLEDGLPGQSR